MIVRLCGRILLVVTLLLTPLTAHAAGAARQPIAVEQEGGGSDEEPASSPAATPVQTVIVTETHVVEQIVERIVEQIVPVYVTETVRVEEIVRVEQIVPVPQIVYVTETVRVEQIVPVIVTETVRVEQIVPITVPEIVHIEQIVPVVVTETVRVEQIVPITVPEIVRIEQIVPVVVTETVRIEQIVPVTQTVSIEQFVPVTHTVRIEQPVVVTQSVTVRTNLTVTNYVTVTAVPGSNFLAYDASELPPLVVTEISTATVTPAAGEDEANWMPSSTIWTQLTPTYWEQTPLPLTGYAMYYNPGVMEPVVQYRYRTKEIDVCADCVGHVALLRAGDINRRVWVQLADGSVEGPFQVVDVAARHDIPQLLQRGWAVDVDYETAQRWGLNRPKPVTILSEPPA